MTKPEPNFQFSPPEVQDIFDRLGIPARFTEAEIEGLSSNKIQTKKGFITFPTPEENRALSILKLREAVGTDPSREPVFFDHPWYLDEPFGNIGCQPGWHSVAMAVTTDSIGQPIYYADSIKGSGQYLPSASEVVLMLFLYFTATGKRLMLNKHTWTRDRTDNKRFVTIGAFGKKGLFVSSHEVGYSSRGLGICPLVDPENLSL
jgi:hypothetical protein